MRIQRMVLIAPALLAGSFCCATSHAGAYSLYSYGEFTEGFAMIWQDAEMRADPDVSSQALTTMPRGLLVEITGPPIDSLLWKGIGSAWYPVLAFDGLQGFVAGTDLALAWAGLDPNTTVLLAVTARNDSFLPEFTGAVLAFSRNGGMSDSIPVWLPPLMYEPAEYDPWSYCVDVTEADGSGLDGIVSAVVLGMWVEGCGYVNTEQLFAWDGESLIEGPRACSTVEAGLFHSTGSLILPSDPDGGENRVTVLTVNENWIEEDFAYVESGRDSTVYLWDGMSFTED